MGLGGEVLQWEFRGVRVSWGVVESRAKGLGLRV